MPQISVIVPVYKAEPFLEHCVHSILEQSFTDLEVLLIDDGSPDQSGQICDALAEKDDRVRVFHKENGGVSSARNLGLSEAKGEYIAFVDADDWLSQNALAVLHGLIIENGADTAGCAHFNAFEDGTAVVEESALPKGVYDKEEIDAKLIASLFSKRVGKAEEVFNGFIWRFLYRKEIIERNDIRFDGAYLEDELFLLEYFCHASRLAMTQEALYYYLYNPQSVTRKYLPTYMETFLQFMKQKEALAMRFDLVEKFPAWKEQTLYAGLLIAVGNEYAKGNQKTLLQKRSAVKSIAEREDMARAIAQISLDNLGRNKKLVGRLLRNKQYMLLSLLYLLKNLK